MIAPKSPTAHTSEGPLPQIRASFEDVPIVTGAHAAPVQCSILPNSPAAQASLGPLPHTPYSAFDVLLGDVGRLVPSKCEMIPTVPTAQTSEGPVPHSPRASMVDRDTVHAFPSQCAIPLPYAAHASFGPLAHTSQNVSVLGRNDDDQIDHALPFQCSIVPAKPTAQ